MISAKTLLKNITKHNISANALPDDILTHLQDVNDYLGEYAVQVTVLCLLENRDKAKIYRNHYMYSYSDEEEKEDLFILLDNTGVPVLDLKYKDYSKTWCITNINKNKEYRIHDLLSMKAG